MVLVQFICILKPVRMVHDVGLCYYNRLSPVQGYVSWFKFFSKRGATKRKPPVHNILHMVNGYIPTVVVFHLTNTLPPNVSNQT